MNSFHWNRGRNFRIIVNDQRNSGSGSDLVQRAGKIDNFFERLLLCAQLDKIDIALKHGFSHARQL